MREKRNAMPSAMVSMRLMALGAFRLLVFFTPSDLRRYSRLRHRPKIGCLGRLEHPIFKHRTAGHRYSATDGIFADSGTDLPTQTCGKVCLSDN